MLKRVFVFKKDTDIIWNVLYATEILQSLNPYNETYDVSLNWNIFF